MTEGSELVFLFYIQLLCEAHPCADKRTEFICRLEILGARSNQTELIERIDAIFGGFNI